MTVQSGISEFDLRDIHDDPKLSDKHVDFINFSFWRDLEQKYCDSIFIFHTLYYSMYIAQNKFGPTKFHKEHPWILAWQNQKLILCPFVYNGHFSLVVVDPNPDGSTLYHLDSYSPYHSSRSVFSNFKVYIKKTSDFLGRPINVNTKVIEVQQQLNGIDCGLFAAENTRRTLSIYVDQHEVPSC